MLWIVLSLFYKETVIRSFYGAFRGLIKFAKKIKPIFFPTSKGYVYIIYVTDTLF